MLTLISKGAGPYDIELHEKYGKTFGYFEGYDPVVVTKDVDFVKTVMIKEFSTFYNHRVYYKFFIHLIFEYSKTNVIKYLLK